MNVRSQIAMVFHLDKCIGCHSCSVACKSVWTDRPGAEYMWWNHVETKPGTGYPTRWEDQEAYRGGWERRGDTLELRSAGKVKGLLGLLHNPAMPSIDDYYEPFAFDYEELHNGAEGADQPVAKPVSVISGKATLIESGPNWDGDLAGSAIYAAGDPNLEALSPEQREALFQVDRLVQMSLPRMCNHCLNPSCVAACPSGALYKRGEDGVVLVNQDKCRGWRACIPACPYKKVYFNWQSGKSEKCNLCYPKLETGEAPACFESCVGRDRYLGVLLYDADRITDAVTVPDEELVDAQLDVILDPHDPKVAEAAKKCGIPDEVMEAAKRSPVYKFVSQWRLALPLHAEHRTLPMLFYVPPMLPVMAEVGDSYDTSMDGLLASVEEQRLPLSYLASLFAAGNEAPVRYALRKQLAVRSHRRAQGSGDIDAEAAEKLLAEVDSDVEEADAIHRLTSLAPADERFVIPAMHREEAMELLGESSGSLGFSGSRKHTTERDG